MNNNKKGQVTIFIIIALFLLIALIIILWPRVRTTFIKQDFYPDSYFSNCIDKDFENSISKVSSRGGSINPSLYLTYNQENIEYLCYTTEYYKTCVMQKPLLKQHIEKEILNELSPKILECIDKTKQESSRLGYEITSHFSSSEIKISAGEIDLDVPINFVLEKGEEEKVYEKFRINKKSSLYDFVIMTSSILNWEAKYGDFDIVTFMFYYPEFKLEKYKQDEGDKIYILTDKTTNEHFVFATRSLAWPAGYGTVF